MDTDDVLDADVTEAMRSVDKTNALYPVIRAAVVAKIQAEKRTMDEKARRMAAESNMAHLLRKLNDLNAQLKREPPPPHDDGNG